MVDVVVELAIATVGKEAPFEIIDRFAFVVADIGSALTVLSL